MHHIRRLPWAAGVAAIGGAAMALLAVTVPSNAGTSGDLSAPDKCQSASTFTGVDYLSRAGVITAAPVATLTSAIADWRKDTVRGRVFHFTIDGNEVNEIEPPIGLTAANATPAEQRVFHLTASDPEEAALTPADPGQMCVLPQSNYTFSATGLSHAWGGGMNVNGTTSVNTYVAADVHWYQPYYEAVCPVHPETPFGPASVGGMSTMATCG